MEVTTRLSMPLRFCRSKHSPPCQNLLPLFVFRTRTNELVYTQHERSGPSQGRHVHTQIRRHVSSTTLHLAESISTAHPPTSLPPEMPASAAPLSCLPLSTLVRSYLITAVSSVPFLLRPSLAVLSFLAHAKSPLLSADRNPLIRLALKKTLYAQFCAGETPAEITGTVAQLKEMGYAGVILGYAKEVVLEGRDAEALDAGLDCTEQDRCNSEEIAAWKNGNLETVRLADRGDFVALKFTGAGRQALQKLLKGDICGPELEEATHSICRLAQERGVRLLFDAEQHAVQAAIDRWTRHFMKAYNRAGKGGALVYGTYQAYLTGTPAKLVKHMADARRHGFTLGLKLVRGAYLGSDPRHLMWPTIEETHRCYDGIAEAVLRRRWNDVLKGDGELADVDLVLASHNRHSVKRARAIREEQAREGEDRIEMVYGQLLGMADNVSCELIHAAKTSRETATTGQDAVDVPQAFKYLVWGTVGQCSKYLLRRAQENRDAVMRTEEGRRALGKELARRMGWAR